MKECTHDKVKGMSCEACPKDTTVSESPLLTGYGAKPLPVIGGMAIIVGQRYGECKECKWHPDVCEYCEVNKLENERIEKEEAL